MNLMKVAVVTVFVSFGAAGFAGTGSQKEVLPAPTPATTQAPAACAKTHSAVVFQVTDQVACKDRCGSKRVLVAQVFASPYTCENCASREQVREMRCDRRSCGACDEKDVQENIQALMSPSRGVRVAAQRSLRLCGFQVSHQRACVKEAVPSAVLY